MRNYTLNIRLAAVMVAPLLLACGSDNTGGGMNYVTVPDCGGAANQVLTTDSTGQLKCQALPAGAVTLPDCSTVAGQALTADGTQPSCTNLNTVDAATQTLLMTLSDVEKKVVDYGTQLTTLGTAPGSQAAYVGLTTAMTNGRITYTDANNVTTVGIPAATNRCVKEFGSGSHMCTVFELYYSAAILKNLVQNMNNQITPGGWAYMQSGRSGSANPMEPNNGLADNCAGYTYTFAATDTNQWEGTTFQWAQDSSGVNVVKFFANTLCNVNQPIACCR